MSKERVRNTLSLFIFRRDLRLQDNTALIAALQNSKTVIPCFIFDPRQYKNNPYKGTASLQFLVESLQDLEKQLAKKSAKLFIFSGAAEKIVGDLICKNAIDSVYINRDYTPFSQMRDRRIQGICKKYNVLLSIFDDSLLVTPEQSLKGDGHPYKVFTPFYRHAIESEVKKPKANNYRNFYRGKKIISETSSIYAEVISSSNVDMVLKGGRSEALKRLRALAKISHYDADHDYPCKNMTTQLSAYLKFGTCSIREIYYAILDKIQRPQSVLRQLYWHDFFTIIAFYYPHVFGKSFVSKFDSLIWNSDKQLFLAWCKGRTGFPIVDAGMRQLNATGFMHNRVRLITASFLVKDLHIHWLWGEKYFANKLSDYDPAINNGNWQWVAGTGTDALPYFRIFNPWLQQKKFDPNCEYIKEWVPELRQLDSKNIHNWYKGRLHPLADYPKPIVEHKMQAALTKRLYQGSLKLSEPTNK